MGQTQSLPLHPSEALFVVLVHFNPQGFQRRDDLFLQSISHLLSFAHVRLVSIELVHNGGAATTPKAAPSSTSLARWAHREVLRTDDVLWAKESLINRGVATARSLGAEYVAWIDGDITFTTKTWAADTLAALRGGVDILQPWDRAQLLGPDGAVLRVVASFAAQRAAGKAYAARGNDDAEYWHPGFAWAARAAVFDRMGGGPGAGLLEATLGSADQHLATALIGKVETSVPAGMSSEYKEAALKHQAAVSGKLVFGAGRGTINHSWHGSLSDRRYVERWDILVKFQFKPSFMARRAQDGVISWTSEASPAIRDAVKAYFIGRNEDSKVVQKADVSRTGGVSGGGGGGFGHSGAKTVVVVQQPQQHHHHHHHHPPGNHNGDDHPLPPVPPHHHHDPHHDHHSGGGGGGDGGFGTDGGHHHGHHDDFGGGGFTGGHHDMGGGFHDHSTAWGSS